MSASYRGPAAPVQNGAPSEATADPVLPYVDYRRTRYPSPLSPPPGWNRRALARPPLWEFVLLSMLLHALAIALFGAPSGGSRQGHAMWGSLTVVLRGAAPEETPTLKIDRTIPQLAPVARPRPQARPRRALGPPKPAPVPAAPESPPPVEAPVSKPPVVPPLLDRIEAPDAQSPPPLEVPPPTEEQTPTPLEALPPAPAPTPVAPAPVEEAPVPAPAVEQAPASPPPVEAAPVPAAPAQASPIETPALPEPEVIATPPVQETPLPTSTLPVPDVSAAPPVAKAPEKPPQAEQTLKPSEIPTPVVPPQAAPATIEPPAATTIEPAAPAAPAPATTAPPAPAPPAPAPSPPEEAPSLFRRGGEEPPRATKPPLDLDTIRDRVGEITREGSGQAAILAFPMPPVPPRKSKLEQAIENARKPDCRTAYQGLGLAAVVPLIANQFGEGTCRW